MTWLLVAQLIASGCNMEAERTQVGGSVMHARAHGVALVEEAA